MWWKSIVLYTHSQFQYFRVMLRVHAYTKQVHIGWNGLCARASAPPRGVLGMLPQENFGFLDLLRSFLMQFWSNKVPANAHYTLLAKTVTISGMRPASKAENEASTAVESVRISISSLARVNLMGGASRWLARFITRSLSACISQPWIFSKLSHP